MAFIRLDLFNNRPCFNNKSIKTRYEKLYYNSLPFRLQFILFALLARTSLSKLNPDYPNMQDNSRYQQTLSRHNLSKNFNLDVQGPPKLMYDNQSSKISSSRGSSKYDLQSTNLTRNSNGAYIYDQVYDKSNMKKMLADDYRSKIQQKQKQKNLQKQQEKSIEKYLLSSSQKQAQAMLSERLKSQSLERQSHRDEYKRSIDLKRMVRQAREQEKVKWRQKQEKQVNNDKKTFFKQFYNNYDRQSQHKDKIYTEQVSPQIMRRQAQMEKFSHPMQRGGLEKYLLIDQELIKQKQAQRQELKQTLKSQINEKSDRIRRNHSESRLAPYPYEHAPSYHNPITNPVSLSINPQNKYIMGQMRQSVEMAYNMSNSTPESSALSSSRIYNEDRSVRSKRGSNPIDIKLSNMARNGSQMLL